jgi:hypothetical protein
VDILNAYGITSDIINIVEMDGWSKCKLDIEIQNAYVLLITISPTYLTESSEMIVQVENENVEPKISTLNISLSLKMHHRLYSEVVNVQSHSHVA